MRIVAGSLRGRAVLGPQGDDIRPTSDRVRGAIFNILTHGIDGFALDGTHVLDLFAGTGALGLEALSRGAAHCLFVEKDAEARGLIARNIGALGVADAADILAADATRIQPLGQRHPRTLAFLDPPYGKGLGERALAAVAAGGWLAPGAVIVVEERAGTQTRWPAGCDVLDVRRWGATQAAFARFVGS